MYFILLLPLHNSTLNVCEIGLTLIRQRFSRTQMNLIKLTKIYKEMYRNKMRILQKKTLSFVENVKCISELMGVSVK